MLGGWDRVDDDCSGNRVAAVECSLRALEHFDLLDIVQLCGELLRIGLLDAVYDHGNGRLTVARLGDSAQRNEGIADVLRLHQRHVRHHGDEAFRAVDACRPDRLTGKYALADRHVVDELFALACRHDDLVESGGLGVSRSGDKLRQHQGRR